VCTQGDGRCFFRDGTRYVGQWLGNTLHGACVRVCVCARGSLSVPVCLHACSCACVPASHVGATVRLGTCMRALVCVRVLCEVVCACVRACVCVCVRVRLCAICLDSPQRPLSLRRVQARAHSCTLTARCTRASFATAGGTGTGPSRRQVAPAPARYTTGGTGTGPSHDRWHRHRPAPRQVAPAPARWADSWHRHRPVTQQVAPAPARHTTGGTGTGPLGRQLAPAPARPTTGGTGTGPPHDRWHRHRPAP
jgi:hypothetical protein